MRHPEKPLVDAVLYDASREILQRVTGAGSQIPWRFLSRTQSQTVSRGVENQAYEFTLTGRVPV